MTHLNWFVRYSSRDTVYFNQDFNSKEDESVDIRYDISIERFQEGCRGLVPRGDSRDMAWSMDGFFNLGGVCMLPSSPGDGDKRNHPSKGRRNRPVPTHRKIQLRLFLARFAAHRSIRNKNLPLFLSSFKGTILNIVAFLESDNYFSNFIISTVRKINTGFLRKEFY